MTNRNYIVKQDGEPVTRLTFREDGLAELSTGDMMDAIRYTPKEAIEIAAKIGKRAEAVRRE